MTDQTAELKWRDTPQGAVPVSTQFDDPYYSLSGGLDETRHVFLDGNDLPDRFAHDLHIAELGFGSGLNFLTTWAAWQSSAPHGALHFTSFEAFPMRIDDMAKALSAFPEIADQASKLFAIWRPGRSSVTVSPGLTLDVVIGDARDTLPDWAGQADAWFLDGFSPAKNSALWEAALLQSVFDHTAPGGTAATYSAAGAVRTALADAGFEVTRCAGFGRKRHMTRARKP